MGDMSNEGAHLSAGIDLSQFFQVFFEEAGENLETMERMLLELNVEAADDEELNAIFRCAHSVKGGAATFGFSDVAELTHQMETLLDKLRRHAFAILEQGLEDMQRRNALVVHADGYGLRGLKETLGAVSEFFEIHATALI